MKVSSLKALKLFFQSSPFFCVYSYIFWWLLPLRNVWIRIRQWRAGVTNGNRWIDTNNTSTTNIWTSYNTSTKWRQWWSWCWNQYVFIVILLNLLFTTTQIVFLKRISRFVMDIYIVST